MENDQQAYHLKKLVEELTTSGKDKLDETNFKKVKNICKRSDIYVIELYRLLSKQLKRKHAEIRFSAFQICDEIFRKSHCFRELLLKDFCNIVDLVLGLDPQKPLPKPEAVAKNLKQKSVEAIQYWYDNFSDGYVTLKLAYNYLRDCKKVDFAELTARTEAERQRAEEERRRLDEIKRKKIVKINNELEESSSEIKDFVVQFQNCFKLLIPDVNDFFIAFNDEEPSCQEGGFIHGEENIKDEGFLPEGSEEEDKDIEYGSEFMRGHGIMKGTSIQINLEDVRKIQETPDNEVVIENLKEHVQILNTKFLPQVKRWEQTMRPYSEGNGSLIKNILELKQLVGQAVKMFESLKIIPKEKPHPTVSVDFDSDDDDDFIEVPFDDPRVVSAAASEVVLLGMDRSSWNTFDFQSDDLTTQPSTSGVSQTYGQQSKNEAVKAKKKSQTIRCPDEYLGKTNFTLKRLHNPLAGLSQVWTATPDLHEQEEIQNTGGVLGVATQRVNYERAWEPIKWTCRAPLTSGRLCPRQDREKCPLHGPIVPRDEAGKPLRPEDAAKEHAARERYERDHPAWQDPQLLAELKAATGIDLKVPKGKQKRKRKYENLTDLRKMTGRDRLTKKVLSKKALRRLNASLAREHTSAPNGSSSFNFGQR
ncbi:UV-stimulated scaffold protein A-like [Homarus americanus]|uniref:UV-stimulated scaffold protein A-like n=1 Tax=Homarus americanus TaxID=6706 RepID=A0A8J5JYZ1_HOMAM|nr:UV-stimulated scaffold protein A-like [Homarus americanus]XP_042226610.1 UV-stimulated scaffold protein A-like [Homarus americanus]XP_042226611.1 UV-stimulated scaffold protein A-like [Homarus americanus]XP_042226612.1 UV-stimulated scaffold protein A-like [Homarus americanus]KAG7166527.1 UV-stimulated scaffold protein A-like [Homarus americanus]